MQRIDPDRFDDDSAGEEDAPARREPEPAFSVAAARDEPVPQAEVHVENEGNDDPAPRRRGWWSRG